MSKVHIRQLSNWRNYTSDSRISNEIRLSDEPVLTSETKLTLTVALTITDTVTLIFMCTSLTPIKRFFCIYKKTFSRRCIAGFVGGAIFCTTQQLHCPFADVAVLSSENASDKKLIIHILSLKEGWVFCGVYKRKRG